MKTHQCVEVLVAAAVVAAVSPPALHSSAVLVAADDARTQRTASEKSTGAVQVARVGRYEKGVFVTVSFEDSNLSEFPLTPDAATVYLRDGRQFPVTGFVFPLSPMLIVGREDQPFNRSRILTTAKKGAKMVRLGGNHQIADIQPLPLDSAPLFCGSRFVGDKVYVEMAFDLPGGIDLADVTRVRLLDFPPATIPTGAIVPWWPVHQGLITIRNTLAVDVLVRLEGPMTNALIVRNGHSESLRAMPGSYHLMLRYGEGEKIAYLRGERFSLMGDSKRTSATIVLDANYKTSVITALEFERDPPVCPSALSGG